MIAATGVFLLTVSVVAAAAAWAADQGLRRLGWPSRWVWAAALAAGPALLAWTLLELPGGGAAAAGGGLAGLPVVELPGLTVGQGVEGGWLAGSLGLVLGTLWLGSSLAVVAALVRARTRLTRERRGWERLRVLGHEVHVSRDRGPAVAGIRSPWMVLPAWALRLPADELRMVVAHEAEHLRARDPLLLAAGLGLVALAPWNPVAWWLLRRLRAATEVDCDRRVLARYPDPLTYGSSLLSVAERATGPSLALAAFTERPNSLEERILTMTRPDSRKAKIAGILLLALAVVVGVQACGVEGPLSPADRGPPAGPEQVAPSQGEDVPRPDDASPGEQAADEWVGENPTFTPFTVAPSIQNRREVVEAMANEYPPLLREAGVSGTVRVYFFIDETGTVQRVVLDQSSGHEALDQAALRVADVYEFSPALNRDEPVPVWVSFPITFRYGGV